MPTHRELVYDPEFSRRNVRRYERKHGPTNLNVAYYQGQYCAERQRRARDNPFPPGRRRDEWQRGYEGK